MQTVNLPSAMIYARHDTRPIVKAHVAELAASIAEIGLISPIVVRSAKRMRNGASVDAWEILAGRHRYEACSVHLHMDEVPCIVRDTDDLHAELVMIDENLRRAELGPAQASLQTARRKEIYEILHPEAKHGAAGATQRWDAPAKLADAFSKDTASRTGRSERAVQRDAARGEALGADLNRIAGTSLDKGVEMDALAKMKPDSREDIVKRAQQGESVSARKIVDVPEQEDREQIEAKKKLKLMSAWNDCPAAVQQWFMDNVQVGLIMDESYS